MVKRIGRILGAGLTLAMVTASPILADTVYDVPDNSAFKSYMSYKTITKKNSRQYNIQQKSVTDENGFRKYNDLYCVAVGTGFHAPVGTHIEVTLSTGKKLSCIVSDIKDNKHTDSTNRQVAKNGNVVEFIVDTKELNAKAKMRGDVSHVPGLEGSVDYIVVKGGGIDPALETVTVAAVDKQEAENGIIITKPFNMVEEKLAGIKAQDEMSAQGQLPAEAETEIITGENTQITADVNADAAAQEMADGTAGIQVFNINGEIIAGIGTDNSALGQPLTVMLGTENTDIINAAQLYGEYDDVLASEEQTDVEDQPEAEDNLLVIDEAIAEETATTEESAIESTMTDAQTGVDQIDAQTADSQTLEMGQAASGGEVEVIENILASEVESEETAIEEATLEDVKTENVDSEDALEEAENLDADKVKEETENLDADKAPEETKEVASKDAKAETIDTEDVELTEAVDTETEETAIAKASALDEKASTAPGLQPASANQETVSSGVDELNEQETYVEDSSIQPVSRAVAASQEFAKSSKNSKSDIMNALEYEVVGKEAIEENGKIIYKIIYSADSRKCSFVCDKAFYDSYRIGSYISLADMEM